MKIIRTERGSSIVELLLILLVVAILLFTGWFVWHTKQDADKSLRNANNSTNVKPTKVAKVTDYESCTKATGSVLQQTYPEICVTKDGQAYTNSAQTLKDLVIKEWGVKLTMSDVALTSASYTAPTSASLPAGVESVGLYTKNTYKMAATCEGSGTTTIGSGNHIYRAKSSSDLQQISNYVPADFVHIGDYWYVYERNTGYGSCEITDPAIATEAQTVAEAFGKAQIVTL